MNEQSWMIIVALILFVIYRRIRRNIGWQLMRQKRMITRITIFAIIGFLFLIGSAFHPISLLSDALGIAAGVLLAVYSAKITHMEQRDQQWHYRPNVWIGSLVSALFLGRLFFRFYGLYTSGLLQGNAANPQQINQVGNSWTAGLLLIIFAYYIVYYIFLLRKHKQLVETAETR
ncbi:CcdC protein domain-containing protein [Sporolactobacillus laevolacticus]|uniref:DUF1453 domain-containing protein n=1 Tax=Sporolactobacillus laevolacticus DSM 442 TaxID=1395513 RepID=V6J5G7_9BACL|nr:CcdC protein domain-containing protein [Sporolactobacillus laevolacticus]EST11969.1 hypothetical protein P343_09060 [Sporolactobacillus laevolacticus DSM 442]